MRIAWSSGRAGRGKTIRQSSAAKVQRDKCVLVPDVDAVEMAGNARPPGQHLRARLEGIRRRIGEHEPPFSHDHESIASENDASGAKLVLAPAYAVLSRQLRSDGPNSWRPDTRRMPFA